MAVGDSIIRVSIIGDVKKLTGAFKEADKATGGLLKSAGGAAVGGLLALGAIDKGFQFIGGALDNADKFSDALDRIKGLSGQGFADQIHDIAFNMSNIGLSAPQVADMAASFDALASAAKVSQPTILAVTPDLLAIAKAVSATTGEPVDEVVADIGKAAAGNQKAVSDYGIVVDKALNPDARILDILDQLKTKFPDVTSATSDLEGGQDKLNAKWDNFTTKFGEAISPALEGIVGFLNDEIDAIPVAIQGWQNLGKAIENFANQSVGPLGKVRDVLNDILDLLNLSSGFGTVTGGPQGQGGKLVRIVNNSDSGNQGSENRNNDRNGVARDRVGGP